MQLNYKYSSQQFLPNDFDWQKYLEINEDVGKVYSTEEQAKHHYLSEGVNQKRIYKTLHLPDDFEWETYLGLNLDVYNVCKNKTSAIMHYERHGFMENRKYKLLDIDMKDFHWVAYIHNNPSLKPIIKNKIEAIGHYYKKGKSQGLSYELKLDLPKDFHWGIYLELNKELKKICRDEMEAMFHYHNEGKKQKLHYKIPEQEIPSDFDWITYSELNTDVKRIYPGEKLAKLHYYITGKTEGRIYKFNHTPEKFDWKLYLELNDTISKEYRINEYTAKLHYDLFGFPQGLPYFENFQHIPKDFNWREYVKYNPDIASLCKSEVKAKSHYNNYGVYQSRIYNEKQQKKQSEKMEYYSKYPFLFHKYILNISTEHGMNYEIKRSILYDKSINFKLIAHLHCYNIDKYYDFYKNYINQISQVCSLIVITFSIGNEKKKNFGENVTLIKCENRGMDIGGKYVCMDYLQKKEIYYNSILFLHTKTDEQLRKLYWEPLIFNLKEIETAVSDHENNIGIYVPPLVYMGDYACVIYKDHFIEPKNITCKWNFGNSLYLNDLERYYELSSTNYMFPEGNCFVCKKNVAEGLYGNSKLYYLLNNDTSFDAVWVKMYYGQKKLKQIGPTIYDIYKFYRTTHSRPRVYPNNIAWGAGHKGHPDNMYEHSFERIVFKVVQKLGYKIKVMPHKNDPIFKQQLQIYNDKINELL